MTTINDFFAAVFCINLKRRPDRLASAKAEFEKHGITVEFIEGVDGKELGEINLTSIDNLKVSQGDIGCVLSHLKVAELAKQRGLANYFVFEDDVELIEDFNEKFFDYIQELPQDWYMIYGGANHDSGYEVTTPHIVRMFKSFTTHAMGVNALFYNAVINMLSLKNDKVDILLSSLHKGGHCYCFMPHLAWQKPGHSDILNKEVDYPHLRNTGNKGNSGNIYMPLTIPAKTILQNHFNLVMNVNAVAADLAAVLKLVSQPDNYTAELFNSGNNIIVFTVINEWAAADKSNYNLIRELFLKKVKGQCIFITINLLDYEFAEMFTDRFEANLNVTLHNDYWEKFIIDTANRLTGYEHTKRFFPVVVTKSVMQQQMEGRSYRNGNINDASDLFKKLTTGLIDYEKVLEKCTYLPGEKDMYLNNHFPEIAIIIPVNGRLEYNKVVCKYFFQALGAFNNFHKEKTLQISITIVEHSEKPLHESLCKGTKVNYVHIPMEGKPFNKSLAHNVGAIVMKNAKNYIFHDVDIIVPHNFFILLFANVYELLLDAAQTFTKRRLLHCNEVLTNSILYGELSGDDMFIDDEFKENKNIKASQPGAAGGSFFITQKAFLKIGGFNDVFFKEYSLEDQHFFDKMRLITDLGFCDNPPIELLHLHHPPAFEREVNPGDLNAYQKWDGLSFAEKKKFIAIESTHLRKFIPWESF